MGGESQQHSWDKKKKKEYIWSHKRLSEETNIYWINLRKTGTMAIEKYHSLLNELNRSFSSLKITDRFSKRQTEI